jgi:hypothetical protein
MPPLFRIIATDYYKQMERGRTTSAREIDAIQSRMLENRRKAQRRRERVERERILIQRADEEHACLERTLRLVRAHADRALVPGGGNLTLKNRDVARVWIAIQDAFASPFANEGLASNQLYEAMRIAVPELAESTMRSHLHRFKKKRVLSQIGFRWFLEVPVRRAGQSGTESARGAVEEGRQQ